MLKKHNKLPAINNGFISEQDYFLLFETSLFDKDNFTSYIFIDPIDTIRITGFQNVKRAFEQIEEYSRKYYLAGYLSYELGYYFEKESFKIKPNFGFPLIHLCVFDKVISFDHNTGKTSNMVSALFIHKQKNEYFKIKNLKFNYTKAQYINKIERIKEYIKQGQTYQVNFTGKYHFDFSGSPFKLYQDLKNRQNTSYGAFCKFKDEYVISLSPELFFKRQGLRIYSRPMKGTMNRGKNIEEDKLKIIKFKQNVKDLAENLMIVDLMRNDLGRISEINSVKVSSLFDIERYNTLFQMTSTIKSILRKDITYFDIFKNIFPGGSVTGAPKIRTMQIIKQLENDFRKIYCGVLGIIFPKSTAIFNLPIRTLSLIRDKGEIGVGGGIVIDSKPETEYEECLLKAKFIIERYKPFQLIETILWGKKYKFLEAHLRRMKNSAKYFDFYFNYVRIISQLRNTTNDFDKKFFYKVRLLLNKEGILKIEYSKINKENPSKTKYVVVSKYRTDPQNIFLYHKTTNRNLYDREFDCYHKKGYYDVIFLNKRGEVTEGTITNILVKIKKDYYTPPVDSGILAGIFRDYLIKRQNLKEKILKLEDLLKADKIFLCNSVRGLIEVKLKRKTMVYR